MDFTPFVLADLSFQMKWENLKGNNDYKNKNTEKSAFVKKHFFAFCEPKAKINTLICSGGMKCLI